MRTLLAEPAVSGGLEVNLKLLSQEVPTRALSMWHVAVQNLTGAELDLEWYTTGP